jgi:cystathionine beta-lyase/cystathionine gamma-synthase
MRDAPSFQTRAIHAGALRPRVQGAVVTPIFQSSTFEYQGEGYHDVGYIRLSSTPNHRVLAARMAALEGTEAALCTSSGMAAIATTLLALLESGDHVLAQDCLYGGTSSLFARQLSRFGIASSPIDPQDPDSWVRAMTPRTRLIYVETLSNPLLQMADLEAAVTFAREHRLVSVIDNTFASPINFCPADLGYDLVVESCTKYLGGHDDLAAGCVAGRAEDIRRVKTTLDHLGGALDPHACFLLERGLKTLPVRIAHQNESAGRIAAYLRSHPSVRCVHHPGLPDHAQHERASRLLRGFGGVFSLELTGTVEAADRFLGRLRIATVAGSLGGVASLAMRPAVVSHAGLTPEERARIGITDGLIRFSVGLESTDDLIADLAQALA